jgi:hypothetical protein
MYTFRCRTPLCIDALVFETPGGLQVMLDQLHLYCRNSSINDKTLIKLNTNVMVFQRGRANIQGQWFCNGNIIETVASFVCLDILLRSNGRWKWTQKRVVDQASSALYGVISGFEHIELHVDQQCYLFDKSVRPVLDYGAEIWGFNLADNLKRFHKKFCKRLLSVRIKSTSNCAVLGDLGRHTFAVNKNMRIVAYWLKCMSNKDTLVCKK